MQTTIIISGQPNGNSTLRSAIISANCEEKKLQFGSWELTFRTKGEAVKAIRSAYTYLLREYPELKGSMLNASQDRNSITFDASRAYIYTPII
jgi:hypothetical protein